MDEPNMLLVNDLIIPLLLIAAMLSFLGWMLANAIRVHCDAKSGFDCSCRSCRRKLAKARKRAAKELRDALPSCRVIAFKP